MPSLSHISCNANKPEKLSQTFILSDINPLQLLSSLRHIKLLYCSAPGLPGQDVNDLLFLTCQLILSNVEFLTDRERSDRKTPVSVTLGIVKELFPSVVQLPPLVSAVVQCGLCVILVWVWSPRKSQHHPDIDEAFSHWRLQPITTVQLGGWDSQVLRSNTYSLIHSTRVKRFLY